MTTDDAICRWAEHKYGLAFGSVTKVDMRDECDPGWSKWTPSIGDYVSIHVWCGDRLARCAVEEEMVPLIREMAAFMLAIDSQGKLTYGATR